MTEKKLSRRDAMKMLGVAVGAATLASLPSKWNTPELAAGVLPAHARQSAVACVPISRTVTVGALVAGANVFIPFAPPLTDADLNPCNFRYIDFAWTTGLLPGNVFIYLAQSLGLHAIEGRGIQPGDTSPIGFTIGLTATGNRPYNGIELLAFADVDLGDLTVTLS